MEHSLHVYLPYPKSTITQRFGENANPLYAGQGLKGHPAYDWYQLYGTKIPNCTPDAYCYSIMHANDPVLMDYRAAFFIVETETGIYEISYGHISEILAVPGRTYQVGETIGLVGNTGPVFVGQHEVTEAEKDRGSHAGEHLHGPQIRVVAKTPFTNTYRHYLMDESGKPFLKDGFFYGIPDYDNGYNGCVSLAPFSTETLAKDYVPEAPVRPAAPVLTPQVVQEAQAALKAVSSLPAASRQPLLAALEAWLRSFLPK